MSIFALIVTAILSAANKVSGSLPEVTCISQESPSSFYGATCACNSKITLTGLSRLKLADQANEGDSIWQFLCCHPCPPSPVWSVHPCLCVSPTCPVIPLLSWNALGLPLPVPAPHASPTCMRGQHHQIRPPFWCLPPLGHHKLLFGIILTAIARAICRSPALWPWRIEP